MGLAGASTHYKPQKYLVKAMSFAQFPLLIGASKFVSVTSHYVHFLLGSFAPGLKALGQKGRDAKTRKVVQKTPKKSLNHPRHVRAILKS